VFFDDPEAAYDVVGATDVRVDVEELRETLLGMPDIVRRVRTAFEVLPSDAGVAEVARALGMSVRSLQRRLSAAGRSLAIAAHVGASSASHLVTLFHQHRGTTPGAIREARKKTA
jgi:AraC-like DNA-binding protein